MDFDLTKEEEAFRDDLRGFLDEHLPPPEERAPDFLPKWWKAVREKRLIGFAWPKQVTGGGGSLMEQFILKEELLARKAPMLGRDVTGLSWVGPALIQFGTDEQKQKYIPEILDGKTMWCTGYSEPDVGSDLASLQCRAERDGDEYVVNGSKIWISLAHFATGIYNLVRTDPNPPTKYDGISCLLIPMDTPGIEVVPIKNMSMTGMAEIFNQVFFKDVRVPVERRLGDEGEGWAIICSALQNERSSITEVMRHSQRLESLYELARHSRVNGRPALEDAGVRRKLASIETQIEALRLGGMRALSRQLRGLDHQSQASLGKLHNCNLLVECADFALELEGSANQYMAGSEAAVDDGRWQVDGLAWPVTVVGGGTPNIQKNIIAERILGLPKD
ncbi:MAG: acyl-CoA dehydrogenase family protein [Deltaproteobacteria bacterium]|jgi:alkylation response protein AidB-like acyl-CoA dehydrogenase|nr:acyl-CoA dehydrogenase family protein [Deltaproteobacteria bacterium]MBW2384698.1 acyl-CoA dehydrogenase family protein [Deltaproteobacteria bacterium]MBW2697467.1 acyl-CoA dehydrogenase family protein [Deltaproteobacteria bacterium]